MSSARLLFLAAALPLAFAVPAGAGANAAAQIGLAVTSSPCGLQEGDLVDFFVAARGMVGVKQAKMLLSWQPSDAISAVSGGTAGLAADNAFLTPGPPLVTENHAEFGMATFGAGIDGEGMLAHFALTLAPGMTAAVPMEVRLDMVSLGRSSAERDTVVAPGAVVLVNYCDDQGQPVARGMFLRPPRATAEFSATAAANQQDHSPGEMMLGAHLLDNGDLRAYETISWTLDNRGNSRVWVLTAQGPLAIEPGDQLVGGSQTDRLGDTFLVVDSAPGELFGDGVLEVTACGELDGQAYCDQSTFRWLAGSPTAVADAGPPQPTVAALAPSYPNPFNASTVIPVDLAAAGARRLEVEIRDLLGRTVVRLHDGPAPAGRLQLHWDGRDADGREVASGVYLCHARTEQWQAVRPLTLAR